MRPQLALTGFSILVWGVSGCGSDPVSSGRDPCPACVTISSDAGPGSLRDPVAISGATIWQDALSLNVTYSGGCREHDFGTIAAPEFELLPGVASRVYLRHDARGDPCERLVSATLEFDLTPLRQLYLATYGVPGGLTLLVVAPEGAAVPVAYDLR